MDGRLSYLGKRTAVLEVRRLTTTRDHSHRDLAAMGGIWRTTNGGQRFKQLPMATIRSRKCSREPPATKGHAMEGHPAPVPGRKARATSSEARSA
jgi:hypothetical protein